MLVKDYMTRHPIMIEPSMKVIEAQKIMMENKIRHLPVVGDGKRLLGLVTRQRLSIPPERLGSLDVWEITRFLSDLTVNQVMVTGADLHTIAADATLEGAADLLIRNKIGGLPVVEDGIVVGIITEIDLLIEFQNLLGAHDAGWRIVMRVPDRLGEFRKLTRPISDRGWGIMAMGSVRSPRRPGYWDIILKLRHCTKEELLTVLQSLEDQELVDIRGATANDQPEPTPQA
jgi:acetoin utilization protein AcuB